MDEGIFEPLNSDEIRTQVVLNSLFTPLTTSYSSSHRPS